MERVSDSLGGYPALVDEKMARRRASEMSGYEEEGSVMKPITFGDKKLAVVIEFCSDPDA